ncbi:MAG: hypothetical protein WCC04_16875 [Terriglobales bacterium]
MESNAFVDWIISRIAKVGDASERLELSQSLAVMKDGNEDNKEQIFRQVEDVASKAKRPPRDAGKLLALFRKSTK